MALATHLRAQWPTIQATLETKRGPLPLRAALQRPAQHTCQKLPSEGFERWRQTAVSSEPKVLTAAR